MKLNLSNGSGPRGAQMGRPDIIPENITPDVKLHLQRLPFTDGCYDKWGAYWGAPANIYCAWHDQKECDRVEIFVRAPSREVAKDLVRARCAMITYAAPLAIEPRFYR